MKIQTINITDVTLDYGGNHNNRKLVDKNCITDSKVKEPTCCTVCDLRNISLKRLDVHMKRKHITIKNLMAIIESALGQDFVT